MNKCKKDISSINVCYYYIVSHTDISKVNIKYSLKLFISKYLKNNSEIFITTYSHSHLLEKHFS